jgi:signal transduction histidine kinase
MTPQTLDEHRLRRLLEVGRSLVSELDLEALLHRVLDVARELTGARYAALGVLDEQGEELERFITTGIDEETRRTIGDLPRGRGILGELIRQPEPLRLRDLSEHPRSYGFPPGHPPMHGFLGVRVLIRGEVYGNLYLTEKDGGEFDADDEHSLVVLAEWAAIAIANARLYSGVEKQRNELQRAVDGLEATSAIAKAVGGETEIDRVLELIVKRGRALVEARTLVILLTEGDHLRVAATAGEADGHPDLQIPIADSLLGDIVRSGKAERLADVKSRVRLGLGELSSDAESALLVPLTFRGHTSGVLIAFDRSAHGPAFDAEDERLLSSFAASAATAVATAQTVEADRLQHSIEAAEQERRRWARELHDETLQGLGALQVLLSTARRRGDHLDEAIAQASTQIEAEIEKLQALITELRPAALDEIGVGPAIESLVERARTLHGLEIESDIDLDYDAGRQATRLTPEIESAIYRLVQESLTNVGKHAGADKALLRVVEAEGQITVEVRDDGRGFDPEQPNGGFGLVGMRERAGLLGGTLEVASEPGEGSTVRARLAAEHVAAGGQEGPAATSGSGAA